MIRYLLNIFLFHVLLSMPISLIGQIDTSRSKSNGIGQIERRQKVGEWNFYYPDGKIMATEQYKSGMLEGLCLAYFPNGQLASKENWKEDLQEDSAWYFHPNGRIYRRGVYDHGVYQGIWITYFESGVVEQVCPYVDGLPDGQCKNWFPTGKLQEIGYYRDGKKDGQFVFYFEEKEIPKQIAQYLNDVPVGLWIFLTKRGKIDRLVAY